MPKDEDFESKHPRDQDGKFAEKENKDVDKDLLNGFVLTNYIENQLFLQNSDLSHP